MYIIPIAWLYVVVLMAATQPTVLEALFTLVFYGLLPCGILMYLLTAPRRARLRKLKEQLELQEQNTHTQTPFPKQANPEENDAVPQEPEAMMPMVEAQPASQTAPKAVQP